MSSTAMIAGHGNHTDKIAMADRTEEALISLRQILRATEIGSRALAKASGLNPSQLILLNVVAAGGDTSAGALAREISLSQATVTTLIDKLVDRGLVARHRDQTDKRRIYIELTEEGKATLDHAPDSLQSRFETRFSKLEAWEQSFLIAALERISAMLDAEKLDAAPVLDVGGITKPVS